MAILLGNNNGDITSSRTIRELMAGLDGMIAEQAAYMMPDHHLSLIEGVANAIREEREWEEQAGNMIALALQNLENAPDLASLEQLNKTAMATAAEYFKRRESVLSMHQFCCKCRDLMIQWATRSALEDAGGTPVPFALCSLGNHGRMEATLSSPVDLLLIYGNTDEAGEAWFTNLAQTVSRSLSRLGLVAPFVRIDDPEWRGNLTLWKDRIAMQAGTPDPSSETTMLCDLRPSFGDPELAGELRSLARSSLTGDPLTLLSALRAASIMPVGFDFFGRLKVEKSGAHRGEFNLVQFALTPLVVTIRMLAIQKKLEQTSTPDRIRGLLNAGELGVDLASKLLMAYHDFHRIQLAAEVAGKGSEKEGFYLVREEIPPDDENCLKQGLEAIFNLQRIVYQNVEA